MRFNLIITVATALLIAFLSGCKNEIVPAPYRPRNEHDLYILSLKQANLLESALGYEWLKSSQKSLTDAIEVETPYQEAFFLDPAKAESIGYRFSVKRGQKIGVKATVHRSDSMKLFIDLYRVNNDSLKNYQLVASADSANHQLVFEPRRDADYILRLQPELLRGGRFDVTIQKVPSFSFPVSGKSSKSIGSYFGDPRDGGKRDHHGVDIFAKRHTPIIAPVKAYVSSVATKSLGGKVIWLRDSKGRHLYFAHLQKQIAKPRTYVNPGDTIGTVGNTGNAKTTPTHLHFGIYKRGPIDPIYFIKETNINPVVISANLELLGNWVRTTEKTYLNKTILTTTIDTLELYQPLKVIGVVESSYRVVLPNGLIGYINDSEIEPTSEPILAQLASGPYDLLLAPMQNSATKANLAAGENLSILARQEGFWFVRTSIGQFGWIPAL
jgi:murein DD-endopeptidase MepM/ murein hydrolase activator NlpD